MKRVAMLVINAFTHDTRVQKEAKTLVSEGCEVTVFALHGGNLPQSETRDGYRVERIHVHSRGWGTALPVRLLKYLEFCLRAIRRTLDRQPDVVHAHDVNALVPGFVAARLAQARLVYDAHELWVERQAPLLQSNLLRRAVAATERFLARRADAVITVNPSVAQFLERNLELSSTPTVLMHCQEYQEVEHSDILRQEFDIPDNRRIVIYPGVFAEGRGLEQLIEAVPYLDRAVVVMMGRGQLDGRLRALVRDRGLEGRVFIREPVPPEEVLQYVSSADVGVMPTQSVDLSYHYGAGNKLFHYMMAGIPAAVSDQPEKRRIVETYGVGAVFDQTDPEDIARTINDLLNDRRGYRRMQLRASRVARERFNWRIESQKLVDVYEKL
jgi:glycosyltransferase involved in cell wall biosynthesis